MFGVFDLKDMHVYLIFQMHVLKSCVYQDTLDNKFEIDNKNLNLIFKLDSNRIYII